MFTRTLQMELWQVVLPGVKCYLILSKIKLSDFFFFFLRVNSKVRLMGPRSCWGRRPVLGIFLSTNNNHGFGRKCTLKQTAFRCRPLWFCATSHGLHVKKAVHTWRALRSCSRRVLWCKLMVFTNATATHYITLCNFFSSVLLLCRRLYPLFVLWVLGCGEQRVTVRQKSHSGDV